MQSFRDYEELLNEFRKKLPPGPEEVPDRSIASVPMALSTGLVPAVEPQLPAVQNTLPATTPNIPKISGDVIGEGTSRAKFNPGMVEEGQIVPPRGNPSLEGLKGAAPFAIAALAGEGIRSGIDSAKQIDANFKDPKNIQAVRELGDAMQPPMLGPESKVPYDPNGVPYAPSIVDDEGVRPDSPDAAKMNVEAQTSGSEPSRADQILKMYRSLASDQSTGLRDAQQEARTNANIARLMAGAAKFTSGITGGGVVAPAKVDNSFTNELLKSANVPVEEYDQQVKDRPVDPSSKYSQIMREFLAPKMKAAKEEALGRPLNEAEITELENDLKNTSGDVSEKTLKLLKDEENAAAKKRYTDAVLALRERSANSMVNTRKDRLDLTAQGRLQQVANSAIKDPNIQANQKKVDAANRIFATVGDYDIQTEKDVDKIPNEYLNNLPKLMTVEMAQELNTLLSNTNVTSSTTLSKIIPKNVNFKLAEWQDFITSKMNPAQQQEFLRLVMKAAVRQRDVAEKNQEKQFDKYLNANQGLKKFLRDEEDYEVVRNSIGVRSKKPTEAAPEEKKTETPKVPTEEIKYYKGKPYKVLGKNPDGTLKLQAI